MTNLKYVPIIVVIKTNKLNDYQKEKYHLIKYLIERVQFPFKKGLTLPLKLFQIVIKTKQKKYLRGRHFS